ncbi:hypothetical protein BH10PAT1_BH10PAT1_1460 [soil metagenome]
MQEYFWSIAIEEGTIQAAIWTIKDNAASVIEVSNIALWENDENLVTSADTCLSSCIQNLPENASEPTKTVFGVPSFWVKEGQIEKEYLEKIKILCNKLSLTPTGFVVLPEAISHFKKAEEKTPLNSVLIGVYPQNLDVTVFRLGNLVGNVNVARSTNVVDDVVEALVRFGAQEPFPSRFLIYGSKVQTLEDAKQDLIKTDWDTIHDQVKFLHTPQVEIVTEEQKMAAVSLAGAAETGSATSVKLDVVNAESTEVPLNQELEKETNIEGVVDAAAMGFTNNFDMQANPENQDNMNATQNEIPNIKKKMNFRMPSFKNFKFKFSEGTAFFGAILLLILLIAGFAGWWILPKANVTIIISPKKIESHQKLIFDTKATSVDLTKNIIPAKSVVTTLTADKTKTATGTKTIGTPSKGSVTFYNVGGSTTIPAGTILTASSMNFSLDSDVTIASASGAASAATAQGNITSAGVGADANLAGGTYFSVGNFSSSLLQAKNDNNLSGGSSQEVTAVSKADADSLTADLIAQLTTNGGNNLKQNLETGDLLVDGSILATSSAKNFDHDIGEAASTVKLSMTAKVSGTTIARADINSVAQNIFASQVPDGFSLKDDQIDFVIGKTDTDFMINLLPTIDTTKLAQQISGKNLAETKAILSKVPGYQDAKIEIKPNIPFLQILPHSSNNITITLSAK